MTEEQPRRAAPYGVFVDWNQRLAREAPLFRELFERNDVHRVIDAGGGTARHAILFAEWGLDVTAVDPSTDMLEEARENLADAADEIAAAGGSVTLIEGGFGDLAGLGLEPADALICTGNALPHVHGIEGLRVALADFASVMRSGAVLVLQLLNHSRLQEQHIPSLPLKVRDTEKGRRVFARIIDCPDEYTIRLDFITLTQPTGGDWELDSRVSIHTAIPPQVLVDELKDAGFGEIELLGDHTGRILDEREDESVIVVARRL